MIRILMSVLVCLAVLTAGLPLSEIGKARASHGPMASVAMEHGQGHAVRQSQRQDCPDDDPIPCCDGWRAACVMHATTLPAPVPGGPPHDGRTIRRAANPQERLTGIDPDLPYEPPRG